MFVYAGVSAQYTASLSITHLLRLSFALNLSLSVLRPLSLSLSRFLRHLLSLFLIAQFWLFLSLSVPTALFDARVLKMCIWQADQLVHFRNVRVMTSTYTFGSVSINNSHGKSSVEP